VAVFQTLLSSVWQTHNFEGDALSFTRATMLVLRTFYTFNNNSKRELKIWITITKG
jgi:hypothetical protein